MHLTDIEALKKVFDSIDTDGSGAIDMSELRSALEKAGKKPTEEQIKAVITKYAGDGKAMVFEEFQKVIADWEDVIANISR